MQPYSPLSLFSAPSRGSDYRLRARVEQVYQDPTGTQLSFLFKVRPLSGSAQTGSEDGTIDNVGIRLLGCGSLDDRTEQPSVAVSLPEVGSIVVIEHIGTLWYIVGFLSGPVSTALETGLDPDALAGSLNPGLTTSSSRRVGMPGWQLPQWSGTVEPGEHLFTRGQARLKVGNTGTVIGGDFIACRYYNADGTILERCLRIQQRAPGLWYQHRAESGSSTDQMAMEASEINGEPPAYAHVYNCEVLDISPYPSQRRPYMVHKRGMIHRNQTDDGRTAVVSGTMAHEARLALESGDYIVDQYLLARSRSPTYAKVVGGELDQSDYALFDRQIDADGSFRLRAGNQGERTGAQHRTPTQQMDLSVEFDARRRTFALRLGPGGQPLATVTIDGAEAASARVHVTAPQVIVEGGDRVVVNGVQKVQVKATQIELEGQTTIKGDVTVRGDIQATGEVTGRTIPLTKHVHGYSTGVTSIPR